MKTVSLVPLKNNRNLCTRGGYFFMYSIKSATITLMNISIIESISKSDIVSPSFQDDPVDRAAFLLSEG